jgi:hypothetical protein
VRRTAPLPTGLVAVALVTTSICAPAEVMLPEGPNRALVMRSCGTCHDMSPVVGSGGRSRDGWNGTIDDMVSYGMEITSADRRLVLEYLATFLPPG